MFWLPPLGYRSAKLCNEHMQLKLTPLPSSPAQVRGDTLAEGTLLAVPSLLAAFGTGGAEDEPDLPRF